MGAQASVYFSGKQFINQLNNIIKNDQIQQSTNISKTFNNSMFKLNELWAIVNPVLFPIQYRPELKLLYKEEVYVVLYKETCQCRGVFLFKNQSNGNRKIMILKARTTLGKEVFSTFE